MTEPYETERQAREAARHIYDSPPGTGAWGAGNHRLLLNACASAGVYLGAYDHRIIEWLTGWEPATCAVIAGLITRAHAAGQAAGGGPGTAQPGAAGLDAEFIIKIGPAFGVVLIIATQRPDKASLPTGVSGNVSTRFCLKVMGQLENDMILGTSAYKNGLRATTFRPDLDAGIGYQLGAGPAPQVVRTFYLDMHAAERIAIRARALREAAGTLTGHALESGR